ncbi:hypothetical protein E4U31_005530, partial [Claviceps sp. LM219 group G6]
QSSLTLGLVSEDLWCLLPLMPHWLEISEATTSGQNLERGSLCAPALTELDLTPRL